MNRIVLATLIASALVIGVVVVVSYGDDGTPGPEDSGPAALPSGPGDEEPGDADMTFEEDPFDFDASTLDPEYVWSDAQIDLTCGQLLGEAQVAAFLEEPIERAELSRAEKYPDGYIVGCKFWSDTININYFQIEYWSGNETVAWCEEEHREDFGMEPDPAGPADSFARMSGDGYVEYKVCLATKKLVIEGSADLAAGKSPMTIAEARALAAFYVANLDMFTQAARTF